MAFNGQTLNGVIVLTSYRLIILSFGPPTPITAKREQDCNGSTSANGECDDMHLQQQHQKQELPSTDEVRHADCVDNCNGADDPIVRDAASEINGVAPNGGSDDDKPTSSLPEDGIELTERKADDRNVEDKSKENGDEGLPLVECHPVATQTTDGRDSSDPKQTIQDEDCNHVGHNNTTNGNTNDDDCEEEEEEPSCKDFDEHETPIMPCLPDLETLLSERADRIVLPLGCLDSVEHRDNHCLHLLTKHVKCFVCSFTSVDQSTQWYKRLNDAISYNSKLEHTFCFKFWKQIVSCKTNSTTSTNHHCNGSSHAVPNGTLVKDSLNSGADSSSTPNGYLSNGNTCHQPSQGDHEKQEHNDNGNKLISLLIDSCQVLSSNPSSSSVSAAGRTLFQGSCLERTQLEFERMSFDSSSWRISDINCDFKSFPTYPQHIIVPSGITDEELSQVASFRSFRRVPAVVWRSQKTGCVIARSSQPEVGWFGWRSTLDEKMLSEIASSSQSSKLLILDARSYAAAVANRAKGGGCECPEYYPDAEVQFMGLANIHSIRKSFQSIRYLCQFPTADVSNWSHSIDSSKWLHHISGLIKSSVLVASAISRESKSVLVHCSDGWDRTPQIIALAEILLDPFYRTIEGFQVLVQREWIEFGHKFSDRSIILDDPNERCPVFLQWMDCVHQLVKQHPSSFEFNCQFLIELVIHVHSGLFGNFICNNVSERTMYHVNERSFSLWSFLSLSESSERFFNAFYSPDKELTPSCKISDMVFWNEMYLKNSTSILDD